MKNLGVVVPLVGIILLSTLQQNHALNSLALQQGHNRVTSSVWKKKTIRSYAAATQLETSSSNSDVETNAAAAAAAAATTAPIIGSSNIVDDDESFGDVEFPPPLTSIDQMKRAATFYSTAVPIIANYIGLIGNIKLQEMLKSESIDEEDIEVRAMFMTYVVILIMCSITYNASVVSWKAFVSFPSIFPILLHSFSSPWTTTIMNIIFLVNIEYMI